MNFIISEVVLNGIVIGAETIETTIVEVVISKGLPGEPGPKGESGTPGVGVPAGGTTGQMLTKTTDNDYDTGWADSGGGGGMPQKPWQYGAGWFLAKPTVPSLQVNIAMTPGRLRATRWILGDTTLSGVAIKSTQSGGDGSVCRLGVYADSGGLPGALVLDLGTYDTTTVGNVEILCDLQLAAGAWWFAVGMSTGANHLIIGTNDDVNEVATYTTASTALNGTTGIYIDGVSGTTMPATFPTPLPTTVNPLLALRIG